MKSSLNKIPIFIIVLLSLSSTFALQCFECLYFSGYEYSDDSCENSPNISSIVNCPEFKPDDSDFSDDTLSASLNDKEIGVKASMYMCSKFTGKIDGRKILWRHCEYEDAAWNRKCFTSTQGATLKFQGKYATDVLGCTCSDDICNRGSSLQLSSIQISIGAFIALFCRIITVFLN